MRDKTMLNNTTLIKSIPIYVSERIVTLCVVRTFIVNVNYCFRLNMLHLHTLYSLDSIEHN